MLKWFESLKNIWGPSKPTRIAENLHHLKWIIEDEIKKHDNIVHSVGNLKSVVGILLWSSKFN